MAKFTASAGFGDASDYESVKVELDADDVRPEYIPAVTREVPVMLDAQDDESGPTQAEDPETGAPLTRVETVTPGRYESQEEAIVRVLKEYLHVEDVDKTGITSLRFTVQYSGEVVLEYDEAELKGWGDDKDPNDSLWTYEIPEAFEDDIREAIKEDIGYYGDFEVTDYEAE